MTDYRTAPLDDAYEILPGYAAREDSPPRFPLQLTGADGNAFMILGLFQRGAERAGWTPEQIARTRTEAMRKDYDHLLATICAAADVS